MKSNFNFFKNLELNKKQLTKILGGIGDDDHTGPKVLRPTGVGQTGSGTGTGSGTTTNTGGSGSGTNGSN